MGKISTKTPFLLLLLVISTNSVVAVDSDEAKKEEECVDPETIVDLLVTGFESFMPATATGRELLSFISPCSSSADCSASRFCSPFFGFCVSRRPNGRICRFDDQCQSRNCAPFGLLGRCRD